MVAIVGGSALGLELSSAATLGRQGMMGSASMGQGSERAFVNLATGNLVLQRQDDLLASRGQGVAAVRTYNSAGRLNDDNADNWSIGIYNQPLRLAGTLNTAGSTLTRTASDGAWAGLAGSRLGIHILDPQLFSANPGLEIVRAAEALVALAASGPGR